nr:carbohydrate binding domain-containing protein [Ruminococcus flavefaciens]
MKELPESVAEGNTDTETTTTTTTPTTTTTTTTESTTTTTETTTTTSTTSTTTTTTTTTATTTTTTTAPSIDTKKESFESGANSWEGRGGASVASESDHFYSGSKSVKVSGRSAAWNGINYVLGSEFKPGGTYSFSAAVMQPTDSAQEMKLQLQYKDSSDEAVYVNIAKADAEGKKWTKLENTSFTIPEDANEPVFYIESTEGTFNFYVDDVQFAAEGVKSEVTTGGGTVGEIKVSNFNYSANLQYKAAPDSYFRQPANHGTVVKENYNGINGNKNMYVYLPYGYDKSKKYNVFYLMHGGGESEETCFNDNNINIDIMLDNMIANGDIEPMIVVTPTFNKAPSADGVWEEMRKSIIPYVEKKYSTYAEDTSIDGLRASRYHRAYGGFSMGGGSTWANFNNNLDIIAYFMPLSGHCWDGAGKVLSAARNSGFKKNEYFVLAATGTDDLAYGNMVPMINELKKNTDVFTYTSDFSQGNLYFLEARGNVHWWPQVRHYIYDALPYFFHENQ